MKYHCAMTSDLDELIGQECVDAKGLSFTYGPVPHAMLNDEELVLKNSAALPVMMIAKSCLGQKSKGPAACLEAHQGAVVRSLRKKHSGRIAPEMCSIERATSLLLAKGANLFVQDAVFAGYGPKHCQADEDKPTIKLAGNK